MILVDWILGLLSSSTLKFDPHRILTLLGVDLYKY